MAVFCHIVVISIYMDNVCIIPYNNYLRPPYIFSLHVQLCHIAISLSFQVQLSHNTNQYLLVYQSFPQNNPWGGMTFVLEFYGSI